MHNVIKHARATKVVVRLTDGGGAVGLEVEDNGSGFDPNGTFAGHLGLRSMRERVGKLGGTIDIESAPGKGTRVRVRIPVAAPAGVAG
jgi:signal transduction histidine kinase